MKIPCVMRQKKTNHKTFKKFYDTHACVATVIIFHL